MTGNHSPAANPDDYDKLAKRADSEPATEPTTIKCLRATIREWLQTEARYLA